MPRPHFFLCVFLLLLCAPGLGAQDAAVRAALYLTGASDPEQLDESLLERLETFRRRPLRLNADRRSRLLSSGLLSAYQVASLEAYRRQSGDILSLAELALVDGFGPEAAAALGPFLSFWSSRNAGASAVDSIRFSHSLLLRFLPDGAGGKYVVDDSRRELALTLQKRAGTAWTGGGYLTLPTWGGTLVLGHFQLRYGQGLDHWTGFRMSTLPEAGKFAWRGSGLVPTGSYAGAQACKGLGWEQPFGPLRLQAWLTRDAATAVAGGANLAWFHRAGRLSATLHGGGKERLGAALEGVWNVRGTECFGEAAFHPLQKALAGTLGVQFRTGERGSLSAQVRALPSRYTGKKNGEYALLAGAAYSGRAWLQRLSGTVEAALLPIPGQDPRRYRIKTLLLWQAQPGPACTSVLRFSGKWGDDAPRADLRWEGTWNDGRHFGRVRLNAVRSSGWGALAYAEGGLLRERWSAYLRCTLFRAAAWADRLYCYERDAPGNFSVTAYYGTGIALAATAGWKFSLGRFRFRLHGRAWLRFRKEKPGEAGLKGQLSVSLP